MKKILVLVCLLLSADLQAAIWNITYPRPLTEFDQRNRYPVQLLSLALDQTGVKYALEPSNRIMLQSRALKQLTENREVNVVWSMTDKNREEELLPIRIPIYKGLVGWRVFLVKDKVDSPFKNLTDLQGLRTLRPIQGHDWPDTKILQSNGFDVITAKEYLALFSMLDQSQGDFFPRSIVEVWTELDSEDLSPDLFIEPKFGVRYPTATYFFVNKRNGTLANLIKNGLERAIKSGEFDQLFMQLHNTILERADMGNRVFFELDNPLLPDETPLERSELWYQP